MTDAEPVLPTLPRERQASSAAAQVGCVIGGLALLPILYVASFAYLMADSLYQWGFCESLDDRTASALELFYWPLLWLVRQAMGF